MGAALGQVMRCRRVLQRGRSRLARRPAAGHAALTRWLLERYCLHSGADRTLLRADIHRAAWPVEPAEAIIDENTLGEALGLSLDQPPALLHFSSGVRAVIWPPRIVRA